MATQTNAEFMDVLRGGRPEHPRLCPAALELIQRIKGGDGDALNELIALAGQGRLVAQAAILELGAGYVSRAVWDQAAAQQDLILWHRHGVPDSPAVWKSASEPAG